MIGKAEEERLFNAAMLYVAAHEIVQEYLDDHSGPNPPPIDFAIYTPLHQADYDAYQELRAAATVVLDQVEWPSALLDQQESEE